MLYSFSHRAADEFKIVLGYFVEILAVHINFYYSSALRIFVINLVPDGIQNAVRTV